MTTEIDLTDDRPAPRVDCQIELNIAATYHRFGFLNARLENRLADSYDESTNTIDRAAFERRVEDIVDGEDDVQAIHLEYDDGEQTEVRS